MVEIVVSDTVDTYVVLVKGAEIDKSDEQKEVAAEYAVRTDHGRDERHGGCSD